MAIAGALAGGAVGGLLAGGIGSLLGGGGDIPEAKYNKPTVSSAVGFGMDELAKEQAKSQDQYNQEATAPLAEGSKIQSQISQAGSPEISAALKSKAGKSYQSDINRMSRQQSIAAFDEKQAQEKAQYALGYRKKQIDQNVNAYEQAAKAQADAYEQEMSSARNNAIAQVLGGVGMAVGVGAAHGMFKGSGGGATNPSGGSVMGAKMAANTEGSAG